MVLQKEDAKRAVEVAPVGPAVPRKPLFERLEMNNKTWVIKQTTEEDKPSAPAPERIFKKACALKPEELSKWRLLSGNTDKSATDAKPVIDCASVFAELRAKKADDCVWVSSANENKAFAFGNNGDKAAVNGGGGTSNAINYKAWLAPERNCSPHSEKFLSGTANKEKLFMMKNLFTTGRTIKSDATWLAPKEGTA